MYFWKTKELANKIRNDEITETEKKNYYLAGVILLYVSMYSMAMQPRSDFTIMALEAALMVLVAVVGISLTFKSNGGGSGKEYIARMAMLSLPITVKLFLASLLIGTIIGVSIAALSLPESTIDSATAAATVFIQCIMFWRLNAAIKYVNT